MSSTRTAPASRTAHSIEHAYHILVGSDGQPASFGAIRVALALARKKNARVSVLTVAIPFPHAVPTGFQIAPPSMVDEDCRQSALEAVHQQLAGVRGTKDWTVHATTGWPADCILNAAENWPASLIVVGIGEHGAMNRWIGSETAVAIAKRSTIPVLAVPQHVSGLPIHAAAAIDFTEASISAAKLAATLLGPNGVLTLIHASMLVKPGSESGSLLDVYTAGATSKLEAIRDRIGRDTKRRVQIAVVNDEIAGGLISYAEQAHCELLALGGHDMALVDRFLLGSTRTKVLRHAHIPVLVAPHTVHES
jgi:nucleotide-binding universal stress UspA family protein